MSEFKLVSKEIEAYAARVSSHPSALSQELFDYTEKNVEMSVMLIGPLAGSLLQFMLTLVSAKRVLEIGTYTGYSALVMAEVLPKDGELITLDINDETTKVGQEFWKRSEHGHKIKLIIGRALDSMQKLSGTFDFILIDADKTGYEAYLRRALELLSDHGLIALDNTLYSGRVLNPNDQDPNVVGIRKVTQFIQSRNDLIAYLAPIRDGIFLVQKKKK